jgi:hypothetical protein
LEKDDFLPDSLLLQNPSEAFLPSSSLSIEEWYFRLTEKKALAGIKLIFETVRDGRGSLPAIDLLDSQANNFRSLTYSKATLWKCFQWILQEKQTVESGLLSLMADETNLLDILFNNLKIEEALSA